MDHTRALAELIAGFVAQRERRAELMPDIYAPVTYPNPGASEVDLAAAERRIGRPLDPVHRQLLQVVDGWREYDGDRNLLGTSDIGRSDLWRSAVEMIEIYSPDGAEPMRGWPAETADALPLCEHSGSMAFVVMADGQDHVAGQVRDFSSGSNDVFHNVETWLRCRLAEEADYLDGVSFGAHGRAWRRVVTADSPDVAEIVAKLDELRHAFGAIRQTWLPEPGPDARPGADPSEIAALRHDHRLALSDDHQKLLRASDGWSGVGPYTPAANPGGAVDLLSVAELREGTRWRDALAKAYDAAQRLEFALGSTVPTYPHLTPFAVSTEIGSRAWVLGTDAAGRVIQWPAYAMPGEYPNVREYLLHLVDEADQLLGMARAAALDTEHIPR